MVHPACKYLQNAARNWIRSSNYKIFYKYHSKVPIIPTTVFSCDPFQTTVSSEPGRWRALDLAGSATVKVNIQGLPHSHRKRMVNCSWMNHPFLGGALNFDPCPAWKPYYWKCCLKLQRPCKSLRPSRKGFKTLSCKIWHRVSKIKNTSSGDLYYGKQIVYSNMYCGYL